MTGDNLPIDDHAAADAAGTTAYPQGPSQWPVDQVLANRARRESIVVAEQSIIRFRNGVRERMGSVARVESIACEIQRFVTPFLPTRIELIVDDPADRLAQLLAAVREVFIEMPDLHNVGSESGYRSETGLAIHYRNRPIEVALRKSEGCDQVARVVVLETYGIDHTEAPSPVISGNRHHLFPIRDGRDLERLSAEVFLWFEFWGADQYHPNNAEALRTIKRRLCELTGLREENIDLLHQFQAEDPSGGEAYPGMAAGSQFEEYFDVLREFLKDEPQPPR